MKSRILAGLISSAILGSTGGVLQANVGDNPYGMIVERNAFALKPPPPPQTNAPVQPPAPPVDVFLTGISTLGGTAKVLLQIHDKAPGKKPEFPPPLKEGDVQDRVEVVSINAEAGSVEIKLDGKDRTLTFEKDSPKSTAAAPAAVNPAGTTPIRPAIPIPVPTPTTAANTAPARTGRQNVLVGGNSASTVPPPTAGRVTPAIPTRPLRTSAGIGGVMVSGGGTSAPDPTPAPAAPAQRYMSREEAIAHINEQKRMVKEAEHLGLIPKGKFPPLPPTPGAPPSPGGNLPPTPAQ